MDTAGEQGQRRIAGERQQGGRSRATPSLTSGQDHKARMTGFEEGGKMERAWTPFRGWPARMSQGQAVARLMNLMLPIFYAVDPIKSIDSREFPAVSCTLWRA